MSIGQDLVKDPGLSLTKLERFLDDITYQPIWRPEADRAADYYDGNQLEPKQVAKMRARGQPILINNLIAPAIDGILGLEAKTRTNWQVVADDDSGLEIADAMNIELNEAARMSGADRSRADAYAAQVKTGLGWVHVDRNVDPFKYKWRCDYVHRNEIWWDWHAKAPDLDDARWLMRRKWVDVDQLESAWPQHEELINSISNSWANFNYLDDYESLSQSEDLMNAYTVHLQSTIEEENWWDSLRKRALTYEIYYRVYEKKPVLITSTGGAHLFNKDNPMHIAAINSGKVQVQVNTFSKMRMAFFIGPHRIMDIDSPHPHNKFPYVPFWGFREDKTRIPYGLIRRMMPPQDEINHRRSKLTMLLNKLTVIKDDDAVLNMSDNDLIDELLHSDSVVNLNKGRVNKTQTAFKVEWGNEIANQQFQVMQEAKQLIQDTAGIYSAFLGQESGAKSGVAIDSLVEQGTTTQGEINDNYRYASQLVGELLLANVVADIGKREHMVKANVGKPTPTKTILLNKREVIDGREVISNDITKLKQKVVLADITSTPGYRQQIARTMLDVLARLPEQFQASMLDLIVEMLDIPAEQRDEMLKRIRQVSGVGVDPEDMTPEQQQAMQRKQQLERLMEDLQVEEANFRIDEMEAKVRDINAKARKTEGEADSIPLENEKMWTEIQMMRGQLKKIATDTVAARRLMAQSMQDEINGRLPAPGKAATQREAS